MDEYYLRIGKYSDLKNKKERILYRFFEMLPGLLSWLTLILIFIFSWLFPIWMAAFIISFVIYWFVRTIYFSFHLFSSYKKMKESENIDWISKLKDLKKEKKDWEEIYQMVVFTLYKEPLEIVRESFKAVMESDWPKERMIVVLTAEEKEKESTKAVIKEIEKEFGGKFFKFLSTWHPEDIQGELLGKAANETWGARKAKEIIDSLKIPYEKIIFSSLDVDTKIYPKYFSCLAFYYLASENPTRCSFQPIPLFINNVWDASPLSRVFAFSSSFWEMMCQERPEKLLTFSSHSMSFKALVEVGFKQTNVVSDDSRIFWQCFLKYNGDYRVIPLYYPISMDANVAPKFLTTIKNVYLQQRRWAYGAGDIAYFLFGFKKNKFIPFSKKISLGFTIIESHWSWATTSIMVFFLGWLPIILGGDVFRQTLISYNLPIFTRNILTVSMIGLLISAYFSLILLPPKPLNYGKSKYFVFFLEWFFLPLIMIFFTAVPSLDAQTRLMVGKYLGFWPTPKIRK